MINTIEEFKNIHQKADIVNYDIEKIFGFGMTYRTTTGSVEIFRKVNGKYIKYPYIQPYLKLDDDSSYELFIIYNSKMYQLEKGINNNTYKIKKEITDINSNINKDDVFYDVKKRIEPKIINEELYVIEE